VDEGPTEGNRPAALPAPMSELDTLPPLSPLGAGPSGSAGTPAKLGDDPPGDPADDDGDPDADADGDAAVTATVSAAAGGVHFTVVTMVAVAVSFTELTDVAPAATGIWACRSVGWVSETELIVQDAAPLPLAQPLVNVGFWLAGCAVSVTVTFEAGPFIVETDTAYPAFCPRWMLACEVWTVTHSWVPALWLVLGLGLAAISASSDAETVAADADADADEDADADADAEADAALDAAEELDGDGDGDGEFAAAPEAEEDADGEGDGDDEGDGLGEDEDEDEGDGDGLGDGLAAGSATHVVSVFVAGAVPMLVTESPCASALAAPGNPASPPNSTKLPASRPAVAARTCLKRITLARLRCSSRLLIIRHGFGGDLVVEGMGTHIRGRGNLCTHVTPDRSCAAGAGRRPDVTVAARDRFPSCYGRLRGGNCPEWEAANGAITAEFPT
jgi:hypothetical protein